MIGNNDWLDYMEYRDHIAHSMGMWDKSKVKYKEKIPVGGGKFRYIYDEPNRNRNVSRRSVPTYFDKNQRDAERRNAERSSYSRRADTDRRVEARNRVRGVENSRRSMENNALTNRQNTNFNVYQRQQRAGYDAQRRAAEQQGMQNRATNNQQIEANKLARGYANQQRVAEQQMTQNRMNSDARMAQRQQTARADAERRDMEQRTAQGRAQNEQDVANKPKNLFDHMGRALGNAANAVGSALNSAGDWVGDRARDVGDWVGDRAEDVSEWVGDRARDTRDWVDQNITGNSARDNAERKRDEANRASTDYWNAIGEGNIQDMARYGANADKAYDEARQSQKEANNSLWGRIAGDDGRFDLSDISRHASNAADAVAGAARDAGDWIGGRAIDVRNWVDDNITGNSDREYANYQDEVARRERQLAADAFERGIGIQRAFEGDPRRDHMTSIPFSQGYENVRNANEAEARANVARSRADQSLFGRVGNAANAAGQWIGDRANEAGRAARNLYDQAGNAIGGVGDWIGDRAAELRDRAVGPNGKLDESDVRRGVNAVGGWLGDRFEDVANLTGIGQRVDLDRAKEQENRTRLERDFARTAYQNRLDNPVQLNTIPIENARYLTADKLRQAEQSGDTEAVERYRHQMAMYDAALAEPEKYARALMNRNDPVSIYQDRYSDAAQNHGAAQRDLREAQNAYNNSPLGRAENFARGVGEAASNALGSASSAARNLIETAGGNIAQALSLAQQRLRYAQNTGNPEMIQDAQEVIRTLESPAFNFRDRMN